MSSSDQEHIMNYNNQLPGSNLQSPLDVSHSYSMNTAPSLRDYIISEDILAGQRLNGRMSNVRRFFCLFVTFDLLLTSLMWIICVMLKGEYIITALSEQVVRYNIHTSLFDIVLVAVCRFLVLILFYALLYINHWIIISLSTATTCGFLITKVFFYDWPHSTQPVFEVLLVLTSFVLAWGEAWFLDFRVIPQESNANRYFITAETERTPLIRNYVQGLQSIYTESVGNFYSPLQSPEGSVLRFNPHYSSTQIPPVYFTAEEEENYKALADKSFQDSWDLYQKKDWKVFRQNGNDCVYARTNLKGKKIFMLQAQMDIPPKYLMEEIFYRVQDMSKWYTDVKESHKVQSLDEHTDITYQICNDGAGGMVSSRDFVNLRRWALVDDCYVISCVKTKHPSLPENDRKLVRAENEVGCTIIQTTDSPDSCRMSWILDVDLKLSLPNFMLDKEMANSMFRFLRDLREHLLRESTSINSND